MFQVGCRKCPLGIGCVRVLHSVRNTGSISWCHYRDDSSVRRVSEQIHAMFIQRPTQTDTLIACNVSSGIFLMSEWIVAIFNVGDCLGRFLPRW